MYNGRGHGGYSFTPREIFTGGTNFEWDGKNIMFTPRQIVTRCTNFERNGINFMFARREIFTGGTNFERNKKNIVSDPHEIFMWGTNLRKMRKILSLEGRRAVQIFKGWLQILTQMRTIIHFPSWNWECFLRENCIEYSKVKKTVNLSILWNEYFLQMNSLFPFMSFQRKSSE